MELLVSDYDGTFNMFGFDVHFNVDAIRKFRDSNHKFALATGRPFLSITKEIEKHDIPYDYLVCSNGNVILNSKNELLYVTQITKKVEFFLNNFASKYGYKCDYLNYQNNIFGFVIRGFNINGSFVNELNKLCEALGFKYHVFNFSGYKCFYIYEKNVNKSSAISKISSCENISSCDIFTVGNSWNDYEMLRDYNGYRLPFSSYKLRDTNSKKVLTFPGLVKKISR